MSVCPYSGAYSSGYGRYNCSSDGPAPELYDRKTAFGFTHFHNSGTGWIGSFYNYFLFTPFVLGTDVSRVSDLVDERAEPGYYARPGAGPCALHDRDDRVEWEIPDPVFDDR